MPTDRMRHAVLVGGSLVAIGGVLLVARVRSTRSARQRRHLRWVRSVGFSTLNSELVVAVELAVACGEAMLATVGASATLKDGSRGIDPQTATDVANERLVADTLASRFPEHAVIGEEAVAAAGAMPVIEARPTWIVDPIDGTQNFCHSMPLSCVSIGHCVAREPVLGVVYDPYRDELFVGLAAEGAYVNGARMAADSSCATLDKAMVLTDLGYERSIKGARRLAACQEALLSANTYGVRIIGSTVLALSWLAAGRCSAVYMGVAKKDCPKPWDWCAALAIGRACAVTYLRLGAEQPFDLSSPSVVASANAKLAADLRRTLCAALVQVD